MHSTSSRITAVYHVRSDARCIETRAEAIAIEQSVELPLDVIDDPTILSDTVGRIEAIEPLSNEQFAVRISLARSTVEPAEAGQLLNMLFGNTSLHDDVVLADVELPLDYVQSLGGPGLGVAGLRAKLGAHGRALTASALKPQGLPASELARIAGQLALGGLDIVKDDHGLADQRSSPFAARITACARAVREANRSTGRRTLYAPSLHGNLDQMREQMQLTIAEGLEAVVIAPMVVGLPAFHTITREAAGRVAIMAHPSMAGAARIAPPLLLGRIFRLLGADATIFPNHGGRFSYSPETCRAIASQALAPWGGIAQTAPTPAGGMSLDRVPHLLDFYGSQCILLIGGGLLKARDRIAEEGRAFVRKVEQYGTRTATAASART